jgi:hypothetical protein
MKFHILQNGISTRALMCKAVTPFYYALRMVKWDIYESIHPSVHALIMVLLPFFQHNPRLLSPGSGAISARYGWANGVGGHGVGGFIVGGGSMASTPEEEDTGCCISSRTEEDEDSGTGSSSESHVIRHIDRNILACQICRHRYRLPKVIELVCRLSLCCRQTNSSCVRWNT